MKRSIKAILPFAVPLATAFAGIALGHYHGHRQGFVDGYVKGSGEGYAMGAASITAAQLASTRAAQPGPLTDKLIDGFRAELPCPSLENAKAVERSDDFVMHVRGKWCDDVLTVLNGK